MKIGTIIAIIGALLALVLAFSNLGMYLAFGPNPDYGLFLLVMAIAGGVGALPGLIIRWLAGSEKNPPG